MKRPPERRRAGFDPRPYLAAVMRHELYGALNALSMTAGLLGERGRKRQVDPEDVEKMAGRMAKQIERATRIVDQYVDWIGPTEASAPRGAPATLADIGRSLESAEPEHSARPRCPVSATLAPVGAEPVELAISVEALRWVLDRVIAFAIDHSQNGEVKLDAKVDQDEGEVLVRVLHGGGALTIDDLHVFERGARKVDPTLVDLAIARRIMTDIGGELVPRDGVFVVRVPVAEE